LGIRTFSNTESVNINVFVTPGIDYVNNSNLVEDAVEMIEFERADSLYITTTPDYDLLLPTTTGQDGLIYPTEAVDNLETQELTLTILVLTILGY
jgi:delta-aminolevulinic acid dehydratase/porphobilinogen synthase